MKVLWMMLVVFSIATAEDFSQRHGIVCRGGARFGDRVLLYSNGRYVSYITSVPFLYRPFSYSESLSIKYQALSSFHQRPTYRQTHQIYTASQLLDFFSMIRDPNVSPTLFVIHYMPDDLSEWGEILFQPPWRDDSAFLSYMRKCLEPVVPIPDLTRPGTLNVAVHVRTLSGDDTVETSFARYPLRHPKLDYHKRQILRVYECNQGNPLRAFLFTDSGNPQELLEYFEEAFAGYPISFDIQWVDSISTEWVVQDFFAMQKFDVLIATGSHFSSMALKFGSFDMAIIPAHSSGSFPHARIDRVRIISKKSEWFPFEMEIIANDEIGS